MKRLLNVICGCVLLLFTIAASRNVSAACQQTFACDIQGPVDRQFDDDCDGVGNAFDNCPKIKNGFCDVFNPDDQNFSNCDTDCDGQITDDEQRGSQQADSDRNAVGDMCDDPDQDGKADAFDNCPDDPNPDQRDTNANDIGDACEDRDRDGELDLNDNCPDQYNPLQGDEDNDRVGDLCDNCKEKANPRETDSAGNPFQRDSDGDGIGDACEGDRDSDTIFDDVDNCIDVKNTNQVNSDSDRFGDACDNCPSIPNNDQSDRNSNGIGDVCETLLVNPANDPDFTERHLRVQGGGGCQNSLLPNAGASTALIGLSLIVMVLGLRKQK